MSCKLYLKTSKKNLIPIYNNFIFKLSQRLGFVCSINELPVQKIKTSVFKSPHVHKKSKDHFELKIYRSVLKLTCKNSSFFIKEILKVKPVNIACKLVMS